LDLEQILPVDSITLELKHVLVYGDNNGGEQAATLL
jgi:hypothetical protein